MFGSGSRFFSPLRGLLCIARIIQQDSLTQLTAVIFFSNLKYFQK